MSRAITHVIAIALLAGGLTFGWTLAQAQDGSVQSLRGEVGLEETMGVNEISKPDTNERFERAYRQQPPLIPHTIDKYQINLKVNQCMRCHDWPYNVEENAPKISETHYIDRNGVALDRVTLGRWFCNQCHVPQLRAKTLVGNDFKSAIETE
jgi:cytochrome c-type protein NapB